VEWNHALLQIFLSKNSNGQSQESTALTTPP
jgi:hypothetical protein